MSWPGIPQVEIILAASEQMVLGYCELVAAAMVLFWIFMLLVQPEACGHWAVDDITWCLLINSSSFFTLVGPPAGISAGDKMASSH